MKSFKVNIIASLIAFLSLILFVFIMQLLNIEASSGHYIGSAGITFGVYKGVKKLILNKE